MIGSSTGKRIGIVGATGAVGVELLRTMEKRQFPVSDLRLLASPRSQGKTMIFRQQEHPVQLLDADAFADLDLVFFSAGAGRSIEFAPAAVKAGAVVVDNSSAFRMDAQVPLVIPEINPDDAKKHQGIIANPNCTTAITLMAAGPLHAAFGLTRMVVASYQAVSGSGAQGIVELDEQMKAQVEGRALEPKVYPFPILSNVIPQVDVFLENGYTKEEMKMLHEARKILHHESLRVSMTCVRVPVHRAHSVAVSAEFEKTVSPEVARRVLNSAPGLQVVDDPPGAKYPLPSDWAGQDDCAVGRIRQDLAFDNGLSFWVCGDQLLKGAALNAVQIAELL